MVLIAFFESSPKELIIFLTQYSLLHLLFFSCIAANSHENPGAWDG